MTELLVPRRFCGPPSSGNGGWTAGALAALTGADGAVTVSLRRPPPLEVPMPVTTSGGVTEATNDGHVVASAEPLDAELAVVEPVPADDARAAEASYPGLSFHPFPTCFSCGVDRRPGDGMRIFPGQVTDQDGATRVAATWRPGPDVAGDGSRATVPVTWAALDCIGGWAGDLDERLMVLARISARVESLPVIGQEHVVVGLDRGRGGRKTFTASAVYDAAGRLVARAEHVWVAVDPAAFS